MAKRRTQQPTALRRPTDAELQILGVIWRTKGCTVRTVHETLSATRDMGYTTVLKLMQIMTDKGLLERDTSVRPQMFTAARSERQTQRQLLSDMLDRAFGGSPGKLVLQALSTKKATAEERQQIRALLDSLEEES